MITIDGSTGEGGGQILRTALALSMVTEEDFCIQNIRAKRRKPGLLRQHLTAVHAAADICQAIVTGDTLGSSHLLFEPRKVIPGNYAFAVGTAGSATLVLQTILPALLLADKPSHVTLEGGTHNPLAPPFDFIQKSFVPQIRNMGGSVSLTLHKHGFYPAGGGKMTVEIQPTKQLKPLELTGRGELKCKTAKVLHAFLPSNIAERELTILREKLAWPSEFIQDNPITDSACPGNVILVEIESTNVTEVVTAFGERGVLAERVARNAVDQAREYLTSTAPVGEHLADQLLLPMALSGSGVIRAIKLSRHAQTNIDIIQHFLPIRFEVTSLENAVEISIQH